MIDNFDDLKRQLSELASIINSFKSEAVQLRIVELVFGGQVDEGSSDDEPAGRTSRARARKKRSPSATNQDKTPESSTTRETAPRPRPRGSSGRPGPGAMLDDLVKHGFFAHKRTMQNILDHCSSKFAYSYKTSDFSPTLARAVRSGKLVREKNKDGQYAYEKA